MRAILYDCSDHPNPRYRGCTFRILDDVGGIMLQAQVYIAARKTCEKIASGLGLELQYVGPQQLQAPVAAPVDRDEFPPVSVAKLVVMHGPAEGPDAGWLF
jgi:hypothetical protein